MTPYVVTLFHSVPLPNFIAATDGVLFLLGMSQYVVHVLIPLTYNNAVRSSVANACVICFAFWSVWPL
jgi:hypothetical protein